MAGVDPAERQIRPPRQELDDSGTRQQLLDPITDNPSFLSREPGKFHYVDPGPAAPDTQEDVPAADGSQAEEPDAEAATEAEAWTEFVRDHTFEEIDRAIEDGLIDPSVFSNGAFAYELRKKVQAHEHYFELITMMSQVQDRIAQTIIRAIA